MLRVTWHHQGVWAALVVSWGDPCTQLHGQARNKQNPISGVLIPQSFPGSSRKLFLKAASAGSNLGDESPAQSSPLQAKGKFTLLTSQPRGQAAILPSPSLGERPKRHVTCQGRDTCLPQVTPTAAAWIPKGNVCACAHTPAGTSETVYLCEY